MALLAVLGVVAVGRDDRPPSDPDRFYHLAISRLWSTVGAVPRAVPQIEDLSWSTNFPEKEFGFHALTALGWHAGGEGGVAAVGMGLTALALCFLYWALRQRLTPAVAVAVIAAVCLADDAFFFRLKMLRPHVLAVAAFCAAAAAVLRRSPRTSALAGATFALSYHAWYMPMALWGLSLVLGFRRDFRLVKTAVAGIAGLVAGTVLNPYFPLNVATGLKSMRIALGAVLPDAGNEIVAPAFGVLAAAHAAPLVLGALGAAWLVWRSRQAFDARALAIVGVCVVFWGLAFKQPRAIEYAVPGSALVVGLALAGFSAGRQAWGAGLLGLFAVAHAPSVWTPPKPDHVMQYLNAAGRNIEAARALIPGTKVINCGFAEGAPLLYLRPDLRFVDLSDPILLALEKPELSQARTKLRQATVSDVRALFESTFRAQAAVCGDPLGTRALEEDPDFVRLSPEGILQHVPEEGPAVFDYRPRAVSAVAMDVGPTEALDSPEHRSRLVPPDAGYARATFTSSQSTLTLDAGSEGVGSCTWVRPVFDGQAEGAMWLQFGGGPWLRVFRHGVPVTQAMPLSKRGSPALAWVKVEGAMGALDVAVCGAPRSSFRAVRALAWSPEALAQTCRERGTSVALGENCFLVKP